MSTLAQHMKRLVSTLERLVPHQLERQLVGLLVRQLVGWVRQVGVQ